MTTTEHAHAPENENTPEDNIGLAKRIGKWAGEHKTATSAVGFAGGALAYLVLQGSHDSKAMDIPDLRSSADISHSHEADNPVALDINNTDISGADPARQLDIIMPILEQQRESTAAGWHEAYSPAFQQPNPDDFTGKRADAQRIMNTIALDLRTASSQSNLTLGHNLVGGPYAPLSATYNSLTGHGGYTAQIDGQPLGDRRLVDSVSDSFTQGTVGDYSANGVETIIVNTINMNDTSQSAQEYVITKVTSADGQHTTEQVQKIMKYGDSDFITGLDSFHPQA